MIEIALGIGLFTGIVMALVLVILVARARMVPTGEAGITLNDGRRVATPVGRSLLDALSDAGIFLPSACGAAGTCGLCRITILEGGGAPLPTETARLTRAEAARGLRLACQVMVKGDLRVEVPAEAFGVRHWRCRVRSNRAVATLIKELVLELPAGEPMAFRAGAFVQVTCPAFRARFADFDIDPAFRDVWDRLDLWRLEAGTAVPVTRAYSMANHPGETGIVMLDVRIAIPPPGAPPAVPPGIVSSYLFSLKPGDEVAVSGPFGHFFARETDREMVFVGGGAGMAPMRAHIFDQLERAKTGRKITFWYGARSRRELFYAEDFDRLQAAHENFRWVVALSEPQPDDDWRGPSGFIHEVLYETYLKDHPAPEDCEYYLCGPTVMLKAVTTMLDGLGVEPESILFDDFGG
jgi:Na+-transporting NADH:ubiquinone oxidoreductase subunit F